jgi:hypothetical protein
MSGSPSASLLMLGAALRRCYAKFWLRRLANSMVSFVFCCGSVVASADDLNNDVPRLEVRFVGGLVAENFAAVVTELGRKGLLSNHVVLNTKPNLIDEIFPDNIIPGGGISDRLLEYVCELNPHVCTEKTGHPVWSVRASTRLNVETKACGDRSLALSKDELCVPDFKISTYPTAVSMDYDFTKENLSRRLRDLGYCPSFDQSCFDKIITLNPWIWPDSLRRGAIRGVIKIPVDAYRLELRPAKVEDAVAILRAVEDVIATRQHAGQFDNHNPNIYMVTTGGPLKPLQAASAGPGPSVQLNRSNEENLKVMNYPWLDDNSRGLLFNKFFRVSVGIWDRPVDQEHCYFHQDPSASIIVLYDRIPIAQDGAVPKEDKPSERPQCGTIRDPDRDRDHGTFVAGMVDGASDLILRRLNPNADLWIYELDAGKLVNDGDPIIVAWRKKVEGRVVNISDDLPPGMADALSQMVTGESDDKTLFVAAAGNDGHPWDHSWQCTIRPACLSLLPDDGKRIISVIGLAANGKELLTCPLKQLDGTVTVRLSTNYGKVFDVGAVGVAFSSLAGNAFGRMCGTSVAAPYVTGLASLLVAKSRTTYPDPAALKERIVVTSDFDLALEGMVRFGRINFGNALDYDKDLVKAASQQCAVDQAPCFISREGKLKLNQSLAENGGNGPPELSLRDIRRISRDASDESEFRVIYSQNSQLQILKNVMFSSDAALTGKNKKGLKIDVKMSNVLDYIPCSEWILHPDGRHLAEYECPAAVTTQSE